MGFPQKWLKAVKKFTSSIPWAGFRTSKEAIFTLLITNSNSIYYKRICWWDLQYILLKLTHIVNSFGLPSKV